MNIEELTIKYCPYQKNITTEISTSNFGSSNKDVTKIIETTVKFGGCLRSGCPFWDNDTCKRAITEVRTNEY